MLLDFQYISGFRVRNSRCSLTLSSASVNAAHFFSLTLLSIRKLLCHTISLRHTSETCQKMWNTVSPSKMLLLRSQFPAFSLVVLGIFFQGKVTSDLVFLYEFLSKSINRPRIYGEIVVVNDVFLFVIASF